MKMISEHSAGGVVYKKRQATGNKRQVLWLVCKHSGYHKWVLPKGVVEEMEDPQQTAVREVLEETGIRAAIVRKITPDVRYKYMKQGVLVDKKVEFYLMKYIEGDIKHHSWEIEEVKWVSAVKALKLLAFPTEQKILRQAIKLLRQQI